MSIVRAILDAGDAARLSGRPSPVIQTDRETAETLVAAIAGEIGCRVSELGGCGAPGVVGMFDGVKIMVAR